MVALMRARRQLCAHVSFGDPQDPDIGFRIAHEHMACLMHPLEPNSLYMIASGPHGPAAMGGQQCGIESKQ